MRFLHIFLTISTSCTALVTAFPTRSSTQDTRTTSYERPHDPPIVITPLGLSKKQRDEYREKVHEDYNGLSFGDEASHAPFALVVDPWHEDGGGTLRATFYYLRGRMPDYDNIIGDPTRPHPIYKTSDATSNRERPKREGDVVGQRRGRHAGSYGAPSFVGQVRGGGHVGSSSRTGIEDVREGKRSRTRGNIPVRKRQRGQGQSLINYKARRRQERVLAEFLNTQREVGVPPYEHAVEPQKLEVWFLGPLKTDTENPDLLKKVREHYAMLPDSDPSRRAVVISIVKGFHTDDSEDKEEHANVRYYYLTKEGKYRTIPGLYHVYKEGPVYRPRAPGLGEDLTKVSPDELRARVRPRRVKRPANHT